MDVFGKILSPVFTSKDIKISTNCRSFGDGFEPRYIFGAEPLDQ